MLRLAVVLATPDFVPATDAADYDRHAVALADHGSYPDTVLAAGGGPTAFRPPGFPTALAAVYAITGTHSEKTRWTAGRVLEALLGTVAVGLIMLLATRLWDRRYGLVAGLVAAVYPALIVVGSSLMAESLYIPLVLGAVLAALAQRDAMQKREPSPLLRWVVLAGFLAGLAALTRSNGAILLVPLALLVWTGRPRWSLSALRAPAVLIAVFVLTLVPWTIRNGSTFDAFVPISDQSGYALAGTFNDQARYHAPFKAFWLPPAQVPTLQDLVTDRSLDEVELSGKLRDEGVRYAKDHVGYVFEVVGINALRLLHLTGTGVERFAAPLQGYPTNLAVWSVYAFWLLAVLAIAGAFTAAARRVPKALWIAPLVLGFSSVLFLGIGRYRVPADPFLVLLAAAALIAGWERRRAQVSSPR